jgi:hypothetical protein
MPKRPEAYFLLSRIYEINKDWCECYTLSTIGETFLNDSHIPLKTSIEYPGKYVFTFEKAVSAWWIGLWDESIYLLRQLNKRVDMLPVHVESVKNNLARLGRSYKKAIPYDDSLYSGLRVKFNGANTIKRNYSQCYQDMFVLTMLNGKRDGRFVEIGCDDGFFNSNTALLETTFGWTGVSIDIVPEKIVKFATQRKSKTILGDATKLNYGSFLDGDYDYLQLDCEPAYNTFKVLQRIPFEFHRFAIITFEHDNYCDEDGSIMDKSRQYLKSFGYVMVVNNISEDKYSPFEDWWVHPDLVDKNIIDKMLCISDETKKADWYMLNKL